MKKIKILYIHHASGWGGAPINLRNIIENLDSSKFDVHVLLLKDSLVKDKLLEKGISCSVCKSFFYRKYYKFLSHSDAGYTSQFEIFKLFRMFTSWYLSKYFFAPRILRNYDFDIAHLNSSVLSDWLSPAKSKGKVVYHIQEPISKGLFGFRYRFIRSEVKKYADKIIAISNDNSSRINLFRKTAIVRNFIQMPMGETSEKYERRILYLGGASTIKGIHVLLASIPMISPEIRIILAGHYPRLGELNLVKKIAYILFFPKSFLLRKKLKQVSKLNNVEIVGPLEDISIEMQRCSVLISPFSAPHFSRPVIESFAFGKPVIVSDVIGMSEIVENGLDGVIIKKNDPKELASAINSIVFNDSLLRTMGTNGRRKADELYNPKVNMQIIENLYFDLMKK